MIKKYFNFNILKLILQHIIKKGLYAFLFILRPPFNNIFYIGYFVFFCKHDSTWKWHHAASKYAFSGISSGLDCVWGAIDVTSSIIPPHKTTFFWICFYGKR